MMSNKELQSDDKCLACKGTGVITVVERVKQRSPTIQPPRCPRCGGTGVSPRPPTEVASNCRLAAAGESQACP
jgi:DnaJ-class molecular chaperone